MRSHYEETVFIDLVDMGGVMYHAHYLKIYEHARTDWLIKAGFSYEWQQAQAVLFAVRRAEVDYQKPAVLGNTLMVTTTLEAMTKTSVTFKQVMSNQAEELLNEASIRVACIGPDFRPKAIPNELVEVLHAS